MEQPAGFVSADVAEAANASRPPARSVWLERIWGHVETWRRSRSDWDHEGLDLIWSGDGTDHVRQAARLKKLAIVITAVFCAAVMALAIDELADLTLGYPLGLFAVILASAIGGLVPGLLATMLNVLLWHSERYELAGVYSASDIIDYSALSIAFAIAGELALRFRTSAARESAQRRTAQAYLRSLFETMPAAVLFVDHAATVRAVNRRATEILARSADVLIGQPLQDILSLAEEGDPIAAIDQAARAYADHGHTIGVILPNSERIELGVDTAQSQIGEQTFRSIYLRDQTAAERNAARIAVLQSEVEQLDRVSALGQLGTAIAHELNQPLTSAALSASAAQTLLDRGEVAEAAEIQKRVSADLFRASAVLQRMRSFVAQSRPEMEWVSARALIKEAEDLALIAVRQARAKWAAQIDPAISELFVDRVQIQQVLLNLVMNATQAMRGCPRRVLRLTVVPHELYQARLTLIDSGPGISDEMRGKLFKPFSTTKPDGLGVGLAISRAIVQAHDGDLWNEPVADGACFHFTLQHRTTGEVADAH